jgi:hypothetical protein
MERSGVGFIKYLANMVRFDPNFAATPVQNSNVLRSV